VIALEDGGSWWRYETTVEGSTWLTTGLPGRAGSLEAEKEIA
jgi:hypothetical protein